MARVRGRSQGPVAHPSEQDAGGEHRGESDLLAPFVEGVEKGSDGDAGNHGGDRGDDGGAAGEAGADGARNDVGLPAADVGGAELDEQEAGAEQDDQEREAVSLGDGERDGEDAAAKQHRPHAAVEDEAFLVAEAGPDERGGELSQRHHRDDRRQQGDGRGVGPEPQGVAGHDRGAQAGELAPGAPQTLVGGEGAHAAHHLAPGRCGGRGGGSVGSTAGHCLRGCCVLLHGAGDRPPSVEGGRSVRRLRSPRSG